MLLGAAKHLLGVKDRHIHKKLAGILAKYKRVYPESLLKTLPPLRGLGGKHVVTLVKGTKLKKVSLY